MDAVPTDRGLDLLAAHCLALDPDAQTARSRLDGALGPDLARMLVFALSPRSSERQRGRGELRVRPVFAA
jgi:hypothetical protein